MIVTQAPYPAKECPRYPACSVNRCPLDPDQDKRRADPGDRQRKCTMEKRVRQKIGANYPDLLPLMGLTPQEAAAAARWSNLTCSQRQAIADRGKQALALSRKNGTTNQAK